MTAFTPSFRQLRYLVELDTQRHFGRAAASLGVGQSTLSAGIADLERLVGLSLVERTKRSVRLTDVGVDYVRRARAVVEASLSLTEFATTAAVPLSGSLRLGIIPTIAPFLLPRVLSALRVRFPDLALSLREQASEAACAALARGALDCVVLALPYDCGRVDTVEIMRDALVLARPGGRARDDDQALLLLEDGHCLTDHGLVACGVSRDRTATMVATSLHTLVELVDAGLGTTFLPQLAIDAGILRGRLVDVDPFAVPAERRIVLAWRKGSGRAFEYQLLARAIHDAYSSAEAIIEDE